MASPYQRLRDAIWQAFDTKYKATTAEVLAATKSLDVQWQAELDAANARHAAERKEICDRQRAATRPIRDAFQPRFDALEAERVAALQRLDKEMGREVDAENL